MNETVASLEGSFSLNITPEGGEPFPDLITFTRAGGIVDSPPAPPGFVVNTGIGSWAPSKEAGATAADFVGKLLRFFSVPEHQLTAREEVSLQLHVSPDGQTLTGEFQTVRFHAANGRELNREKGKVQGRRIAAL